MPLGHNRIETMAKYRMTTCGYCGKEYKAKFKGFGCWTRFHKKCFYLSEGAKNLHTTWTPDEEKILTELYPRHLREEICKRIPYHTWAAIQVRAEKRLNLKRASYYRFIHNVVIPLSCSETEFAYIAGLFDGEGSCGISSSSTRTLKLKRTPIPAISISNTNLCALEFVKNRTEMGHVNPNKPRQNRKPVYAWYLHSFEPVYCFLKAIAPYLIIKRDKAELMMKFCELRLTQLKNSFTCPTPHTDEQIALLSKITDKPKDFFTY